MTRAPLIRARSISSRVTGVLHSGSTGRVLASFERACTLVTGGGEIATLVWSGIGNGPLNVVLDAEPSPAPPVDSRFAVSTGGEILSLQKRSDGAAILLVDLSSALQWNPRPDWLALHQQQQRVLANAAVVAELAKKPGYPALRATLRGQLKQAQGAVCAAYRSRDSKALKLAIGGLCGAGEGLTPAGDDWLAGWLLALWLTDLSDSSPPWPGASQARTRGTAGLGSANDRPKLRVHGDGPRYSEQGRWGVGSLENLIAEIAKERTTLLSRALLACAAAGEADENWHTLLQELARHPQDEPAITTAARQILSHGATSGAIMLSGFLAGLSNETSSPGTDPER